MKDYVLLFHNNETGHEGDISLSCIGDPIPWFLSLLGDSINPRTTLTVVEV